MNEPSSVSFNNCEGRYESLMIDQFCNFPCTDPFEQAKEQSLPPTRTSAPPNPTAPIFQGTSSGGTSNTKRSLRPRAAAPPMSDYQVMNPPYNISNAAGVLSDRTAYVWKPSVLLFYSDFCILGRCRALQWNADVRYP